MSYETVIWNVEDGVGRITLNRPERLNAWNEQFGLDLKQAVTEDARDDAVRAVLITGAGRGFSSGADLKEQGAGALADDGRPDTKRILHEVYHPILLAIRRMPKPVIAAVNGPAVGIGCSLALGCDLILAAEDAYFGLAFVNIGLMPDGGSTAFVPAAVGKARAFELAFLGERVPARQALEWGLINRVVKPESLEKESFELATKLASGPTRSYAGSKRALNRMLYGDLEGQLDLEAEIQHELVRSADFIEGVAAFVEKREAAFKGA
jgi:2-(1,2-epoxy-1,2-dihydrophenyl)acetyl-CoA isomerase